MAQNLLSVALDICMKQWPNVINSIPIDITFEWVTHYIHIFYIIFNRWSSVLYLGIMYVIYFITTYKTGNVIVAVTTVITTITTTTTTTTITTTDTTTNTTTNNNNNNNNDNDNNNNSNTIVKALWLPNDSSTMMTSQERHCISNYRHLNCLLNNLSRITTTKHQSKPLCLIIKKNILWYRRQISNWPLRSDETVWLITEMRRKMI